MTAVQARPLFDTRDSRLIATLLFLAIDVVRARRLRVTTTAADGAMINGRFVLFAAVTRSEADPAPAPGSAHAAS